MSACETFLSYYFSSKWNLNSVPGNHANMSSIPHFVIEIVLVLGSLKHQYIDDSVQIIGEMTYYYDISTIKQCTKHPFTVQNTQHLEILLLHFSDLNCNLLNLL